MALPKTAKLYLDEPYTTSFQADITGSEPLGQEGTFALVLDRSYFFPESGGQLSDSGLIGDMEVVDVREGPDGVVLHHVKSGEDAKLLARGVSCSVDWKRRFDHMQQHTGQHVLSRAFIDVAGLYTESFHMGEDACTIDLAGAAFDEKAVAEAEKLANAIIQENRKVDIRRASAGELAGLDLRKAAPEGVSEIRLVDIDGFDVNPCCGTHVRRTGELGLLKVLKAENVKGIKRVQFKVGTRAFDDYAFKHDIVQHLAGRFTTGAGEIGSKVDKLESELQRSKKSVKRLAGKLAAFELEQMLLAAEECSGVKLVVRRLPDGDEDLLDLLSAGLRSHGGTVAVLGTGDGAVVCCASDGIGVDFSGSAVAMASAVGGSGGGRGGYARLKLPPGVNVENFLVKVGEHVKTVL